MEQIYDAYRELAQELLDKLEVAADDDKVDQLAHELGPYYQQPLEQEKQTIEADIPRAQDRLSRVQTAWENKSADQISKFFADNSIIV